MKSSKTIKTSRLILRQWNNSDKELFAVMNSDPEVMEHFPNMLTKEESDKIAERIINSIDQNGWGLWAVEIVGEADFIGFVGLSIPSFESSFTPCVEIGWRLAKPYWGKGYATEAAIASLNFGFNDLELDSIVSFTTVKNSRSISVMERLGMKFKLNFDHPKLDVDEPTRPHVLYEIINDALN